MPDLTSTPSLSVGLKLDSADYTESLNEATRQGRQFSAALGNAFEGLALKGKSLGDVVRGLAQSLSQAAFKSAFKPLEDAIGSGISGLLGGGLPFANGGVFQGGAPTPFAAGGVISSPITFPLGSGRRGIAGERGAEAIMPLARGPDGRLGVVSAGGSRPIQIHFTVTTPDADSFARSESQIAALLARAIGRGNRNL